MSETETIADAIKRNSTPDAQAARRAEMRASTLDARRRRAADAIHAVIVSATREPVAQRLAVLAGAIQQGPGEGDMVTARYLLRQLADTDEHASAARLALDALGALWAVL